MNHEELTYLAYEWLLKTCKCSFAFREFKTYALEQPDAIGWKNGYSILIECKTSRADFMADQNKDFRHQEHLGVGKYRFYMAPYGLLSLGDIPPKWGLLTVDDKGRVRRRLAPKGNIWTDWPAFETHMPSEILMLSSALRRVQQNGDLEKIF